VALVGDDGMLGMMSTVVINRCGAAKFAIAIRRDLE
jgi:hypothetical protein